MIKDPYEKVNLADKYPEKARELMARLNYYAKVAMPPKGSYELNRPPGWKPPKVWGEAD
jgi:hypothetical protein